MPDRPRLTACLLAALTVPSALAAQRSINTTATLAVGGLGRVSELSPLRRGELERPRGLWVTGTVATVHVGPYVLQARLTDEQADTVLVRDPVTNTMTRLTAGDWVTIATGPGGKNILNPVAFLIVAGTGPADGPREAERLAVTYRVIP